MLPRKVRLSAAPLGPRTAQLRGVLHVGEQAQIFERGTTRRSDPCNVVISTERYVLNSLSWLLRSKIGVNRSKPT